MSPTPGPDYDVLMTSAQKQRYLELVVEYATAESLQSSESPEGREIDVDGLLTRAVCQIDHHTYLHYKVGRGVLGFCRDVDDVVALRVWLGVVAQADAEEDNADEARAKKRKKRNDGFPRWSNDNAEIVDQVAIWRRGWRERTDRVERARTRWMWTMDARKKEA